MQDANRGNTKKTVILVVIALVLSAALLAISIGAGSAKLRSYSEEAADKTAASVSDQAKEVDLANALRKQTADYVYEKESIPAYSYSQVWSMDMSQPSGVTVDDLKLVTSGNLVGLEEAFVKAEHDYGVNCLFVMGIASLESANGTICFRPNNMFGYGSSGFSSKAEGIDVVSRALANSYLTPGGGLYSGTRITDVNRRYAASSTWDEKVCRNVTRYYSVISPNHNSQLEKLK
ncbi:MAG: hypothetical protein Q4A65_02285 [Bacillota bacterium]|nr:hypothetical protein [Bacillota bacterium]